MFKHLLKVAVGSFIAKDLVESAEFGNIHKITEILDKAPNLINEKHVSS
jgi:hypothetical protein